MSREGDRPQGAPALPALGRGAFQAVCCSWMEKLEAEGKQEWLPAPALPPSAVCSGLCPGAKQGTQMGSVSAGHSGPRCWIHHQLVMDGEQSRDSARCRRLGGVRNGRWGRHASPQYTLLLEQKFLEGSGHHSAIPSVKLGWKMAVASACPRHSSLDGYVPWSSDNLTPSHPPSFPRSPSLWQ